MAKRLALYLGAAGYALALWFYGIPADPSPSSLNLTIRKLLDAACFMLPHIDPTPGVGALVIIGPLHGLMYAIVGFVIGKIVSKLHRRGR